MVGIGCANTIIGTLDTGASVNVMPYNLYEDLGLQGLKVMKSRIQLADGNWRRPKGIAENVVVRLGVHILPTLSSWNL